MRQQNSIALKAIVDLMQFCSGIKLHRVIKPPSSNADLAVTACRALYNSDRAFMSMRSKTQKIDELSIMM